MHSQCRMGLWPNFYEGVQFPQNEESLNQFFRQMTPNIGGYDEEVISDAMAAAFEKSGPGILVTLSQGGRSGCKVAVKSDKVEAVIAIEPGGFTFQKNEVPETIDSKYAPVTGALMSEEDFAFQKNRTSFRRKISGEYVSIKILFFIKASNGCIQFINISE